MISLPLFSRESFKTLWKPLVPLLVIASLLVFLLVELKHKHAWSGLLPSFREVIEYLQSLSSQDTSCIKEYSLIGVIVFLSTVCGIPISAVEVTGGILLKWRALLVAFPAKTMGCAVSFLMGRYFWFDFVRSALDKSDYYHALQILTEKSELKFLFLSRFMYVPIWVKNYGASVTAVSFQGFLIASTTVGFLFSVLFVYVGVTTSSILGAMSTGSESTNPVTLALMIVGIICLTVGMTWLCIEVRRKIRQLHELEVDESATRLLASSLDEDYAPPRAAATAAIIDGIVPSVACPQCFISCSSRSAATTAATMTTCRL